MLCQCIKKSAEDPLLHRPPLLSAADERLEWNDREAYDTCFVELQIVIYSCSIGYAEAEVVYIYISGCTILVFMSYNSTYPYLSYSVDSKDSRGIHFSSRL